MFLWNNTSENLYQTDIFPEKYKMPTLAHKKLEIFNESIIILKNEAVTKNLCLPKQPQHRQIFRWITPDFQEIKIPLLNKFKNTKRG